MQLLEQLSPVSASILDDLRRIVRVLRESSRAAEQEVGVSGAQLFVLRTLAQPDARGGLPALTLSELSARTRTHQSTASVVVKRLVERGLVSRAPSPRDARCLQLRLTKRGQRLLERAPLAAQDRLILGIDRLKPAEQKRLASALHELVAAMQLSDQAPVMFFEEDQTAAHEPRRERKRRESARPQPE
jgi:DNA-binding MarR family transcriptional regulator